MMSQQSEQLRPIKLSICISTRNRANVIGRTLQSILDQATAECEIVVFDGASTDNTEECVREYASRWPLLRYIRSDVNGGIDADYDRTVELARGEYCWLASDDDLFRPHAISTMMRTLHQDYSLVIANAAAVASSTGQALASTRFTFTADRVYRPDQLDQLFMDTANALTYIGCVVIKRSLWLARERRRFYGSFFIHIGVIFQQRLPGEAKVIITPLIDVVHGNERSFASRICEIFYFHMPRVIDSLALSAHAKMRGMKPITGFMLVLRACGLYSFEDYRRWIFPSSISLRERIVLFVVALLPGALLNAIMVAAYSVFRPKSPTLIVLKDPRF